MTNNIKIIVVASVTVLAGAFLILINPAKPDNVSAPTVGGLNVQLGLEKSAYSIGETISFRSYIKNTSTSFRQFTFSSTCTEGTLYINEAPTQLIKICGHALSDVNLAPYQTITYSYPFTLVDNFSDGSTRGSIEYSGELKLPTGQHQAKLKWQGVESNPLTFRIE